jgi:hypothetical protein
MGTSSKAPTSVKAAQALFFANTVIWLLLGITSLGRLAGSSTGQSTAMLMVALLMFGNAGAMLVAGAGIGKQRRPFYTFGLAVLVINIILTFTDQIGVLDFISLVIDVVLLGLLIVTRARFLSVRWAKPSVSHCHA